MRERKGDLWDLMGIVDAICITTNGVRKKDGSLVMGAGIAKEAVCRFPGIQYILGKKVLDGGNIPHIAWEEAGTYIVSFPTKINWRLPSSLDLIRNSCLNLEVMANANKWENIALPRPGCGYGGLSWIDVKTHIEPYLDERFIICSK